MTDTSVYLVGREIGDWPTEADPVKNLVFAAVFKDCASLEGFVFEHCTFANVSFKEATIRNCQFVNCAFLSCYFRKSLLIGSMFIGCKFISCEFPRVSVQSCDFKYSRFENCVLPYDEMEHSLPREPNLREELANGLAIAADAKGFQRDRRRYRLTAIQAQREHLQAAVMGQSEWYNSHYSGVRKLIALGQLLGNHLLEVLWGHGEKPLVLVRNILILTFLAFPLVLWFLRDSLHGSTGSLEIGDLIWLSVATFISVESVNVVIADGTLVRLVLTLEAFLGLVALGLLVSLLVRWMLKR